MGGAGAGRAGAGRCRPTRRWSTPSRPRSPSSCTGRWESRSSEAQAEVARAAEVIHHFAGEAERMWVQQMPGPDARHRQLGAPGSGRRGRRDHPLELPGRAGDLEARAGAGGRVRGRGEARHRGAARRLGALRPRRARGAARGPGQLPDRRRPADRRGPVHPSPGGQGRLHRLAPGGRADRRLGLAAPEGALARARWARGARGAARRRPRRRRRGRGDAGLRQLRPGLLRGQPGARARRRSPATCSSACARASPRSASGRWRPTAGSPATTC